ncbi:MAG: glycoside hydrolase family 27 protein [Planctomycetota bacterium]
MIRTGVLGLIVSLILSGGCRISTIERGQTPLMGWSSWNHFRIHIDETMIRQQADVMVASGMKDAGYQFINIDDGYFGGRDEDGTLFANPEKFPGGMKALADYIHSKGLRAGIYSDAGKDTCAHQWDKDPLGVGVGLYQHEEQDLVLMLEEWGYDFIKIDWCGGKQLKMDEQTRYTEIGELIRSIRPDVVYNVCRWQFPGPWVTKVADSWRISGDIAASFESIVKIIDLNADLWPYAGPDRFNDMDMLQVGRGMTVEEDKTHFSMWCMMTSPLLAGNDLRTMSEQTLEILTNKEIIALNQDPLAYQARRLHDDGDLELWAKPLKKVNSGQVAVALLNRSGKTATIGFTLDEVGIDPSAKYTTRNLWTHQDLTVSSPDALRFSVPSHGIVVLKIKGKAAAENPF